MINVLSDLGISNFGWRCIINTYVHKLYEKIFHMLIITNMVTVRNFEIVISNLPSSKSLLAEVVHRNEQLKFAILNFVIIITISYV